MAEKKIQLLSKYGTWLHVFLCVAVTAYLIAITFFEYLIFYPRHIITEEY